MLRSAASRFSSVIRASVARPATVGATRTMSHGPVETDEQFDKRYENYFNRCEIDAWEVRKGMNDLLGMDLVPDPKVIIAALKACRRLNDFALAVRWLEGCKEKCGDEKASLYPYMLNEIRPTLTELGIPTVEEIGYDIPELALRSVYDK